MLSSASAGLSCDPGQIEPPTVARWTARHVQDDGQAVFIAGNGFRAAGAIEPLEAMTGRPVLTSNQMLLWNLLAHADATFEVRGKASYSPMNPGHGDEPRFGRQAGGHVG
jgi:maleate isomerase